MSGVGKIREERLAEVEVKLVDGVGWPWVGKRRRSGGVYGRAGRGGEAGGVEEWRGEWSEGGGRIREER